MLMTLITGINGFSLIKQEENLYILIFRTNKASLGKYRLVLN